VRLSSFLFPFSPFFFLSVFFSRKRAGIFIRRLRACPNNRLPSEQSAAFVRKAFRLHRHEISDQGKLSSASNEWTHIRRTNRVPPVKQRRIITHPLERYSQRIFAEFARDVCSGRASPLDSKEQKSCGKRKARKRERGERLAGLHSAELAEEREKERDGGRRSSPRLLAF